MKKILCVILASLMVLSLCACAGGGAEQTQPAAADTTAAAQDVFMAGFAQVNITPDFAVPLTGYGNQDTRISTGKLNDLFVSVLAVRDAEGNSAVMISADLMINQHTYTLALANWVQDELGIPASNVIFSSKHQHSTPDLVGEFDKFAQPIIKDAIKQAVEDLAPAEMYINSLETKSLNFVRHYWNTKGEMVTPNHGDASVGLVSHESEVDNVMQFVKFKRTGDDKKDIVVVNFQTHPYKSTSGTKTQISSDWIGVMREKASKELDCNVMYFSGAGGNVADRGELEGENKYTDFKAHGEAAAKYIIKAEEGYEKVETGTVKAKQITVDYKTDKSMSHLISEAAPIQDEMKNGDFNKAKEMAAANPNINSIYHANYIMIKSSQGDTRSMTISAISLGDVAFTAHPYEMFDTNGMELKGGTVGNENYAAEDQLENPYKMTIVTTIANGYHSYIPSKIGYENGGYATDVTYFAPGSGELIVGDYLHILNELHG